MSATMEEVDGQPPAAAKLIRQFPSLYPTKREHIWVLPRSRRLGNKEIMVRLEYHRLLKGILKSLRLRQENSHTVADHEDSSVSGTDPFPPRPEMARIEALGPENELSQATQYPNPFVGQLHLFQPRGLLVITGLPGIGKTMFLKLIFHLRVAANLPTLLMSSEHKATIYINGEVWNVSAADIQEALETGWIPDETWCLLDCNPVFHHIPQPFAESRCFVVLAASPRSENLMSTKEFLTRYCIMRPWSLPELYDGLQFQDDRATNRPTPAALKAFFERYGGSARHAYTHSCDRINLDAFETTITHAVDRLRKIDKNVLRSAFTAANIRDISTVSLAIPNDITHMFLSVFPLNDEDRTQFRVGSPSEDMVDKALEILANDLPTARKEFFELCAGVQNAAARGWSATLFNCFYHDIFSAGGVWILEQMKRGKSGSENAWWETDVDGDSSFLHADITLTIDDNDVLDHAAVCLNSVRLPKEDEKLATKSKVYYIPNRQNFPAFDSFYIDKPHHAFGFQTSITLDGHDIKQPGVEWLKAHDITKISYIFVTPLTMEGKRRVKMPLALADELVFDSFYHLALLF
ncbi:hypothetical protein C8R44DRAFT_788083 [Mycena epipterygia]|nr:hypothetical protein C8R44DRAFT_788083 [Mycena epipterygia]